MDKTVKDNIPFLIGAKRLLIIDKKLVVFRERQQEGQKNTTLDLLNKSFMMNRSC